MMKETGRAGPAVIAATPGSTNMPVPMTAPTPRITSSYVFSTRFKDRSPFVPAMSSSTGLVLNIGWTITHFSEKPGIHHYKKCKPSPGAHHIFRRSAFFSGDCLQGVQSAILKRESEVTSYGVLVLLALTI